VRHARSLLREGETLILDGRLGVIYADPDEAFLDHYHEFQRITSGFRKSLELARELPSRSIDGELISLQANAEREDELKLAVELGADGIGLYRTEFLYLRGAAPDEETPGSRILRRFAALNGRR
jgi:phosphotransferase system enzyme I (PtsI)